VPVPAPAPAAAPPSEALKAAFGILRRERTDDDALPARALAALKASGLTPVDAQAARLLRADGAARAWVVPVPDAGAWLPGCGPSRSRAAREGLAVVSLGGAPAGGGGALRDLQRGTAPAALDPCAGAGRTMLGVSGIVPDGVDGVFVTGADGSATRADVHDNGFAFVLPRPQRPEPRYLVWTGSDGKPHVQPLAPVVVGGGRSRACPPVTGQTRVTPSPGLTMCGPPAGVPDRVIPRSRPLPRAAARRRARSLARASARGRALARARRSGRRGPPPLAAPIPAFPLLPGICAAGAAAPLFAPAPVLTIPHVGAIPVPPRPAPRAAAPAAPRAPLPAPRPPRAP
jgi:hypothetical protein